MPTISTENLPSPSSHHLSSAVVSEPLYTSATQHGNRQDAREECIDQDAVELDTLESKGSGGQNRDRHPPEGGDTELIDPSRFSISNDEDEFDSTDDVEEALLGGSSDPGRIQMKRKTRNQSKARSSPLTIATGQNGQSNGSMNSHIELRRKVSTEPTSPEAQRERLMLRPGFSLDDEPPPTPQTPGMVNTSLFALPEQDRKNFLLLCLLYFLQGVPMGLASGSVPFLLKPYLSYGQIGVFSLASYPYSLKLLWSPIVDAVWSPKFGRRKSWITPIQMCSGFAMIYLGGRIEEMMAAAGANNGAGVWGFTWWWFLLVFLCATQDIAVDGWAITLLSPPNISYASTAQTVGLTAGHFLSYTVFLAFNSKDFANRWFRTEAQDVGLLSLGTYLTFWGWTYLIVTIGLAVLKKEDKTKDRDGIVEVYKSMWSVLKLKNIQTIIIVHLIAKIGFQANDAVTSLKLLEKGFGQDNMALVVLVDFPFEIGLGYYAGKWSTEYTPMRLWCWAFVGRLIAAVAAQLTVVIYPAGPDIPTWYLLTVIGEHVFSTFMNTVMFVAISAFHARIADPIIGGTYMTLLATYVTHFCLGFESRANFSAGSRILVAHSPSFSFSSLSTRLQVLPVPLLVLRLPPTS